MAWSGKLTVEDGMLVKVVILMRLLQQKLLDLKYVMFMVFKEQVVITLSV